MNIKIVDPFHPLYKKVLARTAAIGGTVPSFYRQIRENGTLVKLIRKAIWAELDLFYNFYHDGGQSHGYINWKDPANFTLTKTGGVTHNSLDGSKGNGSNGYYNTGWDPFNNGVKFLQDDCCFMIDVKESSGATEFVCGSCDAGFSKGNIFRPRSTVNAKSIQMSTDSFLNPGSSNASGFQGMLRNSNMNMEHWVNGAVSSTYPNSTSTGITSQDIAILAANSNGGITGYSAKTVRCYLVGSNMKTKQADLFSIWQEHLAA